MAVGRQLQRNLVPDSLQSLEKSFSRIALSKRSQTLRSKGNLGREEQRISGYDPQTPLYNILGHV